MKRRALAFTLASFAMLIATKPGLADVGNDNPTGVTGQFNGDVTTGASYDPYTANAVRSITDISVNGAVGDYGLSFVRTMNSRYTVGGDSGGQFGRGGNWSHNYAWRMNSATTTVYDGSPRAPIPTSITVWYPDSHGTVFTSAAGDSAYRAPAGSGIADRVFPPVAAIGLTPTQSYACSLRLPDGGRVAFRVKATVSSPDNGNGVIKYDYTYTCTGIYDSHGLGVAISYPADGSMTLTEPAGRCLKVFYIALSDATVIDRVEERKDTSTSTAARRTVKYHYTFFNSYSVLNDVVYYGDTNLTATYKYQAGNTDTNTITGAPLLWKCVDPMYPGPMWRIAYEFEPGSTGGVYGQLKSEKYLDAALNTGAAVSTLTVNSATLRTETRADAKTRTFTYSGGKLVSWTDFKGISSSKHYDAGGFVDWIKDGLGHQTDFVNEQIAGRTTQTTFPAASDVTPSPAPRGKITTTYGNAACLDTNNQDSSNPYYVCSTTDEAGNTTQYKRDTNMRVVEIDYPDLGVETFSYNSFGQVLLHVKPVSGTAAGTESWSYDTRGLVSTYRSADHQNTTNPNAWFDYGTLDRINSLTTYNTDHGDKDVNYTTSFLYNSRGQLTTTTLPPDPVDPAGTAGHTIVNAYNMLDGTLQSRTDQLSHVTSYTYDDYRRIRTVKNPPRDANDTAQMSLSYDHGQGAGNDYTHIDANVTLLTLPSGRLVKKVYDENYRLISETASAADGTESATTSYNYDNAGNQTGVVAPNEQPSATFEGKSTTIAYDERNRPMSVTDPLTQVTSVKYDQGGRKKIVTYPNLRTETIDSFDPMNRPLQRTMTQTPGSNAVTKFTYYPSGALHTMQDPKNSAEQYAYTYDVLGRQTGLTYPAPANDGIGRASESITYDLAGRLATFTNRSGSTLTIGYDTLNRKISTAWRDATAGHIAPDVRFTYDAGSRLTKIDNTNAVISRSYYADNSLQSETQQVASSANTITYQYNPDGLRQNVTYPGPAVKSFTYSYTGRNQLWGVLDDQTQYMQAAYSYDENGNMANRWVGNNWIKTDASARDALGQITHLEHQFVDPAPPNAAVTKKFDYGYDAMSNRNSLTRDGGTAETYAYNAAEALTRFGTTTMGYDVNGNRASVNGGGTYISNNLNQFTNFNGSGVSYDGNGNLSSRSGWAYSYDEQNRLVSVNQGTATVAQYTYDGLNRQVKQTISSGGTTTATVQVWDGWNLIQERNATTNALQNSYLYGAGEIVENITTGNLYFQDALGSTSHLTNTAGNLLERYTYGAFGAPTVYDAGGSTIGASGYGVRHLFQGQLWTKETLLNDHRNRVALPAMGVFMQPDPIGFAGDPTNLYRFVGNNPANVTDPSGLQPPEPPRRTDTVATTPPVDVTAPWSGTDFTVFKDLGSIAIFNSPSSLGKSGPGFGIRTGVTPQPSVPAPRIAAQPLPPDDDTATVEGVEVKSTPLADPHLWQFGPMFGIGEGLWMAGQPWLSYRWARPTGFAGEMPGSAGGTSVASFLGRRLLGERAVPFGGRVLGTKLAGAAAGRAVPYIGVSLMVADTAAAYINFGLWSVTQPEFIQANQMQIRITGHGSGDGPRF